MTDNPAIELHELKFTVEKSVRYNARREDHYRFLDSSIKIAIVAIGGAWFVDFYTAYVGHHGILAASSGALGVLSLFLDYPSRIAKHATTGRLFNDLLASIKLTKNPSDAQIRKWDVRRDEIDQEEPSMYRALEAFCDNEVNVAYGLHNNNGLVPLTWWQRRTMNLFKFGNTQFPDRVLSTCLASEAAKVSGALEKARRFPLYRR
ncbi:MAG: hypothetical protein ACR2RE_04195, partial [Geminicoccaceae bacterium]